MTRHNVEKGAQALYASGDRWRIWMNCGTHIVASLPTTESGEQYCPSCCTLVSWVYPGFPKTTG